MHYEFLGLCAEVVLVQNATPHNPDSSEKELATQFICDGTTVRGKGLDYCRHEPIFEVIDPSSLHRFK